MNIEPEHRARLLVRLGGPFRRQLDYTLLPVNYQIQSLLGRAQKNRGSIPAIRDIDIGTRAAPFDNSHGS